MLGALIAAYGAIKSGGEKIASASKNPNDPKRAAAARQALDRAVAGSLSDAQYMLGQRFGSATQYGKDQFNTAWAELLTKNPAIAAEALKTKVEAPERNDSPSWTASLKAEYDRLLAQIKAAGGDTIQRIGAGVSASAGEAVDPGSSRVTLPLKSSTIYIAIAVLVAIGLVWYASRHGR